MKLTQWLLLVAVVIGVGCLQVAQRNAVFFSAYAVGERASRLHSETTGVTWLNARVIGLSSPNRLTQVAQERRLKLVAWSTLAPSSAAAGELAPGRNEEFQMRADDRESLSLLHVAAVDPGGTDPDDQVSD